MPSTLCNGVHVTDHLTLHQIVKERSTRFNKWSVLRVVVILRKETTTFYMSVPLCLSVRPHGTTRTPVDWIFIKFDVSVFFENLSRKLKFH